MKLLGYLADRVRSWVGAIRQVVAPHTGPGVVGGVVADIVQSRRELILENAMLRHQIVILRRKSPRPRFTTFDRLRLLVAAAVMPTWRRALAIVQPETLLRWHRHGFRIFWRRRSRAGSVDRRIAADTITLIREMATRNRLWGAERIRGELLKVSVKVSKRTVQKYMRSVSASAAVAARRGRPSSGTTLTTSGAAISRKPTTCSSGRCSFFSY